MQYGLSRLWQYSECSPLRQAVNQKIPSVECKNRIQPIASRKVDKSSVSELNAEMAIFLQDYSNWKGIFAGQGQQGNKS
jgi:hypothetical protein